MFYHEKNEEGQCYMSDHKGKIIICIAVLMAVAGFICMKKRDEMGCCKRMGK